MDPLSEVLSLLKLRSYAAGGFGVRGQASILFPRHDGVKCYAVLSGQCWLKVEGVPESVVLHAGDCFLLPRGLPFSLSTDPALTPVDYRMLLEQWNKDSFLSPREDTDEHYIAGGHFALAGSYAAMLLSTLPPIVHIRKETDKAAMRWSLERMKQELLDPQPGGSLISQQLATMMLVQALRLHLAEGARGGVGWLFALADPQMNAAITLMHEAPGQPWTLQELAARTGMSRSVFALRFKQTVGSTPMEYLTRWRMVLAGDRLQNSGDSISTIAGSLGYESDSAFGKAFRRIMGCSPRQYSHSSRISTFPTTAATAYDQPMELAAAD